MKKKLTVALIVLSLLLAAVIGVVVYMETGRMPAGSASTQGPSDGTDAAPEQTDAPAATETTEETVGYSLPTEAPEEQAPVYDFPEEDQTLPEETVDPQATQDPDEDVTPVETF